MKRLVAVPGILLLALGVAAASPAGKSTSKSSSDKWLHVHVQDGSGADAERVKVNVPLSLAEAVIPAINVEKFHGGKVKIEVDGDDHAIQDVDLRKVLQALKDTKDGNFVTVEGKDNVQVAKQGGYLIAKVREGSGSGTKVDVKVPFQVVEALLSGKDNELNVAAAVRALGEHGDGVLVTVDDQKSKVRIWVDSENESE